MAVHLGVGWIAGPAEEAGLLAVHLGVVSAHLGVVLSTCAFAACVGWSAGADVPLFAS